MTGQYRKIRKFSEQTKVEFDRYLPGWDDMTESEMTAYGIGKLVVLGCRLMERNEPLKDEGSEI